MEITLEEATKLLDNIMVNYSQWHTERSTNKKVHAIEEINVLSGKMDELMKLFSNKSVPSNPNDMPLSTFIENNNESMDVNFVGRNNFGNNVYRGNFNSRSFPSNSLTIILTTNWLSPFARTRMPLLMQSCKLVTLVRYSNSPSRLRPAMRSG